MGAKERERNNLRFRALIAGGEASERTGALAMRRVHDNASVCGARSANREVIPGPLLKGGNGAWGVGILAHEVTHDGRGKTGADAGRWAEGEARAGGSRKRSFWRGWTNTRAREWVDGEVIIMSPVSHRHVEFQRWLLGILMMFVEQRDLGEVGGPEFLVRLAGRKRQLRLPDVYFLSKGRMNLIRPTYLDGSPDAIFEVVSPESQSRDRREKFEQYEAGGVREYWILDPLSERVEAYRLEEGAGGYVEIPVVEGKVGSTVVAGFYFRPEWMAAGRLPKLVAAAREFGLVG